jgi:hypothetical protein
MLLGVPPAAWLAACASAGPPAGGPAPVPDTVIVTDTVRLTGRPRRDPELEQQLARLQLQLLERDARVEQLQQDLTEARREVVRAMARLQTLASRAEAASGMAEAEIALEFLRAAVGPDGSPVVTLAEQLLMESAAEFNKPNYGGALYLANEARSAAGAAEARLAAGGGARRSGEVPFEVPVPLRVRTRSNVREGPGRQFPILFTLEGGALLTGHSHTEGWVRVTDEQGWEGWIFQTLVGSRQPDNR